MAVASASNLALLSASISSDMNDTSETTVRSGFLGALVADVGGCSANRQLLGCDPTPFLGARMEGFAGSQDPSESSPDIAATFRYSVPSQLIRESNGTVVGYPNRKRNNRQTVRARIHYLKHRAKIDYGNK